MPPDYEGTVRITLHEALSEAPSQHAVLYIHGYVDYFFQHHMAESFTAAGIDFYALDLRKYGPSRMPHQHPDYCRDMEEYFPDIDTAIEYIGRTGAGDITLLGHSTGGLLAALYCARGARRDDVARLLLNSPFLELNTSRFVRSVVVPAVTPLSVRFPYIKMRSMLPRVNFQCVHSSAHGEWDFDLRYKPPGGFPLYLAWLRAVRRGQKQVHAGLGLQIPVLSLCSAATYRGRAWAPEAMGADSVLDAGDIARRSAALGSDVRVERVAGGMHDLVLSPEPVRSRVLARMAAFVKGD